MKKTLLITMHLQYSWKPIVYLYDMIIILLNFYHTCFTLLASKQQWSNFIKLATNFMS